MARYTALTKPDDSGEQAPIAKLELDGYTNNEFWDGEGSVNEFWPYTAVGALIYLFTGRRPEDDKEGAGVEIPDSLGWHIALLMDFWCDLWGSLSEEGGGLGTDSNNSLREYLAYQTAQGAYPSRRCRRLRRNVRELSPLSVQAASCSAVVLGWDKALPIHPIRGCPYQNRRTSSMEAVPGAQ